jgi:hypothetical protein
MESVLLSPIVISQSQGMQNSSYNYLFLICTLFIREKCIDIKLTKPRRKAEPRESSFSHVMIVSTAFPGADLDHLHLHPAVCWKSPDPPPENSQNNCSCKCRFVVPGLLHCSCRTLHWRSLLMKMSIV